ncbi:GNAT family N-acetyltransferase [Pantoea stewartii]|uniref:GNAT family N-acetyltransferase n=1 Tax=Pantoea stewartii TaxID=66269 RepID=UPI0021D4F5DF|nr:GNAT family N-acetyltransferase [Pantoea stewartii]MCU7368615.1 GNAT family N-acetyltransferase [Pantoea stewartii]
MTLYESLSAGAAHQALSELVEVLQACVADGASVGFIDPDDRAAIHQFWQRQLAGLEQGQSELLVARQHGTVVATVMLNASAMPNGRHRAEISKLLVHPRARRQGIARQLMQQAEQRARQQGKRLLVLDTRRGDVASELYLALNWQVAGFIPLYAESIHGEMDATTLMFKLLT